MSLFDFFRKDGGSPPAGETETVRKIVGELRELEPDRARFVAAFAFTLGRVAHADRDVDDDEIRLMEEIVKKIGHLPEAQAVLAVEIAKAQNELFGGTESFVVTREFKELSSRDERLELLACLFAVSAADDSISSEEEAQIRQIAGELGLEHADFIAARSAYSDKREIMRQFRKDG